MASFGHAVRGLRWFMRTQHNAWIHLSFTTGVVIAGFYFNISVTEWLFTVLAMGLVWATEGLNTAIEVFVDMVEPDINPEAGRVKDVAAGAVLMAVIFAAITGLIIFLPKFAALFGS